MAFENIPLTPSEWYMKKIRYYRARFRLSLVIAAIPLRGDGQVCRCPAELALPSSPGSAVSWSIPKSCSESRHLVSLSCCNCVVDPTNSPILLLPCSERKRRSSISPFIPLPRFAPRTPERPRKVVSCWTRFLDANADAMQINIMPSIYTRVALK